MDWRAKPMSELKQAGRVRPDGRKPLLLYLQPDVIRRLKRQAIDEDTHVYLLVERMLSEELVNRKAKGQDAG
jgi:hypothetical protein